MKRKINISQISLMLITTVLLGLWVITGVEKIWDLNAFHTCQHLWFNGFFILINIIAFWIFHSINKGDKSKQHKNKQPARSWIIKYFPHSSSVTTYNSIKFYREIFALYR